MAGAATILGQAIPCLLNAFPGWKQPVHMHLRATIGASGAATVVSATSAAGMAGTTPSMTLTRQADGSYDLTYPPCRSIALGTVNIQVQPAVIGTVTEHRQASVDKSTTNTNATTGKLRFVTTKFDGTEDADLDPVTGSEIHLSFWADLG